MKSFLPAYVYLFLSALIFISGCSSDDSADTPAQRTLADVKVDFAALDLAPGIHDVTLEFLGGKTWDFRVIAPAIVGSNMYPLIFDLHGASGGAADAHQKTDCYLEESFENMEAFMIVPNGRDEIWSAFNNQEQVINLLFLAREFWPIDPNKVALTGYSNGGNGSWFFGETQPSLFSAAIPMASSYTTIATNGSVRVMPIPMYVIHGENDDLFPVEQTEEWVTKTVDEGSDITFVIAPGLGHYEPCNYVPYLKEAVIWLDNLWQ